MKKKILFVIIDGLGDEPIKELDNKTPLDAARTPNLDFLAKEGICGLIDPFLYHTAIPTSEDTHFALFGYDVGAYQIRRGILTVTAAGMKMKPGDIALRGNFGTVDARFNMIDRRAGRISETEPLIEELNGLVIDGVKFLIKKASEYRIGIILRGRRLSSKISDGDPHYGKLGKRAQKIVPLDKSFEANRTAEILNKFIDKAHQILKNHSLNKKREKLRLPSANYLLVRGASSLSKRIPSFKERYGLKACCIAGKPLYKQIGEILGMDLIKVSGATGLPNTNLKGKISAAKRALKKYNFVFLHIKAADSLAEDGNFLGKKGFVERIDKNLFPLLSLKNTTIVVTGDHSTCSLLKSHCLKPIPILIFGTNKDKVRSFSERHCQKGKLGKIKQLELMPKVVELINNKLK